MNRNAAIPLALIAISGISISPVTLLAQSTTRSRTVKSNAADQAIPSAPSGFAVVELFTSQGCSSCPPADAALKQVASLARKNSLPVYALSFHVDYWNRLGWTDPYSDKLYSRRQGAYAAAAGTRRVYTPQMVVNGTAEFVGSDRAKAHTAIVSGLKSRSHSTVVLERKAGSSKGELRIRFRVTGETDGSVLNVAVVETPRANQVPTGENAGRELSHVNVVRAFHTVSLDDASGEVTLSLPDGLDAANASVVGYVQRTATGAIIGAAAI